MELASIFWEHSEIDFSSAQLIRWWYGHCVWKRAVIDDLLL